LPGQNNQPKLTEKFGLTEQQQQQQQQQPQFTMTKSETAKLAPSPSEETKQQPRWLLINSGLCVLALDSPTGPMTTSWRCRVLIPSEN
jgi:hypothetical protein